MWIRYIPEDRSRRSCIAAPPPVGETWESAHVTWKSRAKSAGLAMDGGS